MNRPRRRDRALWRGDDKVVAPRLTFHLNGTLSLIGDAAKGNEAIPLPTLGTLGIFVVNANPEHLYLEMHLGFDGDTVPARLDCIGVSANIAEDRMVNLVYELSRILRHYGAGGHQTGEQADCAHGKPCQWVRARSHVALLDYSPSPDANGPPRGGRPFPPKALHGFNDP